MDKIIRTFFLFFSLLYLSSCATIHNPLTGKKDLIYSSLNTDWEIGIGKQISNDIEKRYPIYNDPVLNSRLNTIGQKIAAVSDRQDLPYTFKIINSKEINAFTIFGGHVYVFRGALINIPSDDEIACLIAHEVGHVVQRHLAKHLQTQMGYSALSGLSELALTLIYKGKAPTTEIKQLMNLSYKIIALGYSRNDEIEADRLAVRYAKLAGFDPKAMISLLNRIEIESKSAPAATQLIQNITIIRSHPGTSERIKAVKSEIENLENP